jgi:hypothetical protein
VAGILHLGNIGISLFLMSFFAEISILFLGFSPSESDDGVACLDFGEELGVVCDQFGLDPADFQRCLISRSFGIRSIVTCMFSVQQVSLPIISPLCDVCGGCGCP